MKNKNITKRGVMKKILYLFLALSFLTVNSYAVKDDSLYDEFCEHNEIKVYLKDVKNEADHSAVNTETFKKSFNEILKNRKQIRFVPVDSEDKADVTVNVTIKLFAFTKEALPLAISPLLIAADIVKPKSSHRLEVDYQVIDAKNKKELLAYKSFVTYGRRPRLNMTEEEGYKRAVNENINRFVVRAFYKPKDKKL